MNTEELKARIAELETQNKDLSEKVANLTESLVNANGSNDFMREQNRKFHKALIAIKSITETMLP